MEYAKIVFVVLLTVCILFQTIACAPAPSEQAVAVPREDLESAASHGFGYGGYGGYPFGGGYGYYGHGYPYYGYGYGFPYYGGFGHGYYGWW